METCCVILLFVCSLLNLLFDFLSASAVKFNHNLQDLFLGDNKLVASDGQCLGAMLKGNYTLQLLDLRNNNLQVKRNKFVSSVALSTEQNGCFISLISTPSHHDHHYTTMSVHLQPLGWISPTMLSRGYSHVTFQLTALYHEFHKKCDPEVTH